MNDSPADTAPGRGLPTSETESWDFSVRLHVSQFMGCETSRPIEIVSANIGEFPRRGDSCNYVFYLGA